MADEQSKIAAEQVPIYDKAVEAQLGSNTTQQSGSGEGTSASTEIQAPQPPASNPGADNPTGGISDGAGGLSSTAHIESPVPNQEQGGILSTVKNIFSFGKPEEIKAEDKGPAEDATTAPATSLLAGGAATAGALGGTAQSTSTSTSFDLPSGTEKGTYLDYQQATGSTDTPAFPSSQTLPIRSTPGGSLPAEDSSSTAQTDTTSQATGSIDRNTSTTTADDSSNNIDSSSNDIENINNIDSSNNIDNSNNMTGSEDTKERTEPLEHKPPQPADGKPSGRQGMENVSAIPTAGGKRLGEENWGDSKVVADDPVAAAQSQSKGISSEAGQPTDQVRDNTAKNTGGATSGPHGQQSEGKEKLTDKIKDKLHIGKK